MRRRRTLAATTIAALLLSSLAGCSKKKDPDQETPATPTGAISQNNPGGDSDTSFDYIILGGYFLREDANLTIYVSDNGWYVNGVLFPKDSTSPLILTGPLTYQAELDLVYSQGGDELTFTFAKNSMTIKVNKGSAYTAFEGSYQRTEQTAAESSSVSPAKGSALALIGGIAAAHYMAKAEGIPACTIDLYGASFDNAYMAKFLLAYADLFLASDAVPVPEISTSYLFYTFTEADLNNLLLAATAGTFGIGSFDPSGSDIVLKDGSYYIPCRGSYAGGLATSYTNADPDVISEHLLLEAAISKIDGTRYDIEMTLSTSESTEAGAAGVRLNSVTYKLAE